jgi:lambda family phage portal protein
MSHSANAANPGMAARSTGADVHWGLLDAAVSAVAPRWGAKRYAARVAIANMRRGYDAAARDRNTDGWVSGNTSADAEISTAGAILRNRMRDLVRNNAIAAQAVQVLVNNIVGTGIVPRANTGDAGLDKAVDDLWRRWAAGADAHGHTTFQGMLSLAVREMIEGGDLFAVKRVLRASGRDLPAGVPLKIELREADHLAEQVTDKLRAGSRVVQGIEYDKLGRRAAYWMYRNLPGDSSAIAALKPVRVPADKVAHLFERQRVQNRGVPWGTPAMRAIRDVDDWQRAELVRKKTEACMVGIVFGADEDQMSIAPQVQDADGNLIEQFEPGLIAYARGGKDIKFNQPSSTAGVYEWHKTQLHIIASGFRVPYALMTGDLSQTSFSSSRVGLNEFRRMVSQLQHQTVIPMFCEPVWRWFVEMAQAAGLLPDGEIPAQWTPPRFESVNPLQDAQADMLEVRAGFSSLPQQIARRGQDPETLIEDWAAFAEKTDGLGLVFDSDPRLVTKAGLVQASDPTQLPDQSNM